MAKKTLKTYGDKLKDARWQKKRLEILDRDGWACTMCGADKETQLHVHHLKYAGDPWEVDSKYLITLCEDCHEGEHIWRPQMEDLILDTLRGCQFNSTDLSIIAAGFYNMPMIGCPGRVASLLNFALRSEEVLRLIDKLHGEHLTEKYKDITEE